MTKEKMLKLLNSPVTADVILGLNILVNHFDTEYIESILKEMKLGTNHHVAYWFTYNNTSYAFTGKLICRLSSPDVKELMYNGKLELTN